MVEFLHICEVCEAGVSLDPDTAFDLGWDYPPRIYIFGVVSPRTCPDCSIEKTVWWALVVDKIEQSKLNDRHVRALERILQEPAYYSDRIEK